MKLCGQKGLPWVLEPKSKFYHWISKGIHSLHDLWNEEKDRWEYLRCRNNYLIKKMNEKTAAFIQCVSWVLKRLNFHFKTIFRSMESLRYSSRGSKCSKLLPCSRGKEW
jgi:hypothetical protein